MSVQLIIFIIVIFLILNFSSKILDIIFRLIGLICLFQILYIIGLTPINDILPISTIFKYDIFSMIGALFPGTTFETLLNTIGTSLTEFIMSLVDMFVSGN